MAVITGSDYTAIATSYGQIKKRLSQCSTYLYQAVNTIVLFNTVEPTVDLLQEFLTSYQVNTANYGSDISLIPAVKKINSHVLSRGGYASINAFLTDKGATVPQAWADLCLAAGTTIDPSHIVG